MGIINNISTAIGVMRKVSWQESQDAHSDRDCLQLSAETQHTPAELSSRFSERAAQNPSGPGPGGLGWYQSYVLGSGSYTVLLALQLQRTCTGMGAHSVFEHARQNSQKTLDPFSQIIVEERLR